MQLGAQPSFTQGSKDSFCLPFLVPVYLFSLVQRHIFDVRELVLLDHWEAFQNPFLFPINKSKILIWLLCVWSHRGVKEKWTLLFTYSGCYGEEMYSLCAVGACFYPSSIQVIRRMLKERDESMGLDLFWSFYFFFYETGLCEVKYCSPHSSSISPQPFSWDYGLAAGLQLFSKSEIQNSKLFIRRQVVDLIVQISNSKFPDLNHKKTCAGILVYHLFRK